MVISEDNPVFDLVCDEKYFSFPESYRINATLRKLPEQQLFDVAGFLDQLVLSLEHSSPFRPVFTQVNEIVHELIHERIDTEFKRLYKPGLDFP